MQLKKYYLYAIDCNNGKPFNTEKTLLKLEQILKSGYILSRRKLGDIDPKKGGWNGFDYISLCDYLNKDAEPYENNHFYKGYTAYEIYISSSLSLILNKKGMNVVKPELMPPAIFDWNSLEEMRILGNHSTRRFSDLPDEIQVKNRISLKKLEGITLPISYMLDEKFKNIYSKEMIIIFLNEIKQMLEKYNMVVPIYDLFTTIELNNSEDIDFALKKINNNIRVI